MKYKFSTSILFAILLLMPVIASAATYSADTDGDGYAETITTSTTGINVFHPKTSVNSVYSYPSTGTFSINSFQDTDGIAGVEIIVIWVSGATNRIDVIHDKTRQTSPYTLSGTFSINSVTDTDGVPGNEIIVVQASAIDVIHDTTHQINPYSFSGTFSISGVTDTDGVPGNEIIVVRANGIDVIHDASRQKNPYSFSGAFSINSVTDTDGVPGNEIIVVRANGIDVIHDTTRQKNPYGISGTFTVLGVNDYDGASGAEICYSYSTFDGIIIDRTGQVLLSLSGCVIPHYTVTATAGPGGTIAPSSALVGYGATTSFTVTPNTGYHIAAVSGCGGTLTDNIYTTGAISAACAVSATFAINPYNVTPIPDPNCSISPSTPQTVNYGATKSFTVIPSTGYHIVSVSGCGGTLTNNTYTTGVITADCSVTAICAINFYTVTPTAGTNGSISPSTPQTVNYGATKSFTVTPNTGYHIAAVSGCGGTLTNNTYTTGVITTDCTVTASFIVVNPSKIGVFRSNGGWYLDQNGNGVWDAGVDSIFSFDITGDIPVTGDWNGTGTTKIGVYDPATGTWYLDYNGNGVWDGTATDRQYIFGAGMPGAVPVTGDWNGTGTTMIGVYDPATGIWYLDYNGNGVWDGAAADRQYIFGAGMPGVVPVTGDWNGTGTTMIGVYDPATGAWYLDYNGSGVWDGAATDRQYIFGAGMPGVVPVTGDWNGMGTTTIGVYDPATGAWYLDYNGSGVWDGAVTDRQYIFGAGMPGAVPVTGKW